MVVISEQGKKNSIPPLADQEQAVTREEEEQVTIAEASIPQQASQETDIPPCDIALRPLTRVERRTLWLREFGEQDVALHMWTRLVEQHELEIELLLQMHGLLVFGVLVSTRHYAQFYVDLNETLHREHEPETADTLRGYYLLLMPPQDQPEIGQEGLPIISRYIHLRDVTIMSAGQRLKLPYWRGKLSEVDAFVLGAEAPEET